MDKFSLADLRSLFTGTAAPSWQGLRPKTDKRARMLRPMPPSARGRNPGLFHAHRRLKGPMVRATGIGSYAQV